MRRAAFVIASVTAALSLVATSARAATPFASVAPVASAPPVTAPPVADPVAGPVADITDEADWIVAAQLPDGAIADYADRARVIPYAANYAAIGLAEATRVTGDGSYLAAAWRWLQWYAVHENAKGYVGDYGVGFTATGDAFERGTGEGDSTDGYAGTYLIAVLAAYRTACEVDRVRDLLPGINGAVRAIESTMDRDGLTWSRPDFPVKYLMDEAEAQAGLVAAARLATVVGDQPLRTRAWNDIRRMRRGVDGLWNPRRAAYDWAQHGSRTARAVADWRNLWPDASEQMWAVAFAAGRVDHSAVLLRRFTATHPRWATPTATDRSLGMRAVVGYWPVIGWAYLRHGNKTVAAAAAASIRAGAVASGRAWPFTTGIAGQLIVLESGDTSLWT